MLYVLYEMDHLKGELWRIQPGVENGENGAELSFYFDA